MSPFFTPTLLCFLFRLVHFAIHFLTGTRTPDEVVAKVKTFRAQDASGLMSTCKTEISAKSVPVASAAVSASAAAPAAVPKSSPGLSAAAAPDAPAAAEEDDWTSSEQKALEVLAFYCHPVNVHRIACVTLLQMALKEFPPSMAPADRWKAISTR
jgi:hypothetical protein